MSQGSYISSFFVYVNMGCHMIYILKNRLKAQSISQQKTEKILKEIIKVVFKEKTLLSFSTPQEPWPLSTIRELYKKYANSSMMKLDQSSMQKLIYLMLMSVKKQIYLLSNPLELYSLTLGHILTLFKYVSQPQTEEMVMEIAQLFRKKTTNLKFMQYLQIRQHLLSQMENYQSKVINFQQSGAQNANGKLLFVARNSHNARAIDQNFKHPQVVFNESSPLPTDSLPLHNYYLWKSSLVVDYAEEYQKQSQKRIKQKPKAKQQEKNLNDFFSIGSMGQKFLDFEVQIDLLGGDEKEQYLRTKEEAKGSKVEEVKGKTKNSNNNIQASIDKQFQALEGEQEQEQDLLDLMDN